MMRSYGRFLVHARHLRAARGLLADLAVWARFASLTALVAGLAFGAFWDGLTDWFGRIPGDVWEFVTKAVDKVKQFAIDIVEEAKSLLRGLVNGVARGAQFLAGALTDTYNFLKGYIEQGIRDVQSWSMSIIHGAVGAVSTFAHDVYNGIMSLLQPLIDQVAGLGGWVYHNMIAPVIAELRSLGDWIYHHMIVPAINDVVKWTTLLFGPIVEWYRQVFGVIQWLIDHGMDALRWLVDHIPIFEQIARDPFGWVEHKLHDLLTKAPDWIVSATMNNINRNADHVENILVRWLG